MSSGVRFHTSEMVWGQPWPFDPRDLALCEQKAKLLFEGKERPRDQMHPAEARECMCFNMF